MIIGPLLKFHGTRDILSWRSPAPVTCTCSVATPLSTMLHGLPPLRRLVVVGAASSRCSPGGLQRGRQDRRHGRQQGRRVLPIPRQRPWRVRCCWPEDRKRLECLPLRSGAVSFTITGPCVYL